MRLPRLRRLLFVATLAASLPGLSAFAQVRLPKLWSDHAVLQRDRPIHLWGWAAPGERVTTILRDEHGGSATATATTDPLGHWNLALPPHQAGGPYTLTVSASNTVTLQDLWMGDVWLASGQSNMELPLRGFPGSAVLKNGAQEIAAANHPEIRLLHEPKRVSMYPLQDQEAT